MGDAELPPLPEKYTLVWRDAALSRNSGSITVWRPEAPEGFAALGCVVVAGSYEPAREMIRCIRVDLLFGCNIFDAPTWQATSKDRLKMPVSFWQVDNLAGTFLASKGQDTHAEHLFKVLDKDGSTDLSFDEFSGIGHVAAEILGSIF